MISRAGLFHLDTNVISELMRPSPTIGVASYVRALPPDDTFTSAICEAEIRYGLAKLPAGKRRNRLARDVNAFLREVITVVPFDSASADAYAEIKAFCEMRGRAIEVEDAMIAATARVHGATLLTRNVRHFQYCGIKIVDPWAAGQ